MTPEQTSLSDKKWLSEIDKLLLEINNLSNEDIRKNTRRNMMRKQLIILKRRMGFGSKEIAG